MVVSALGGTTDALIAAGRSAAASNEAYREALHGLEQRHLAAAQELLPTASQQASLDLLRSQFAELQRVCDGVFALGELSARTLDKLMSYGELLSSQLVAAAAKQQGLDAAWADSRQLIRTNSRFGNAEVDMAATDLQVKAYLNAHKARLWVVPGFIGADAQGNTTTLGRGGSDYTAALLAAALGAEVLEIWTDVSGMMTADPRLVSSARPIARISYQEAMELSHFGAKVLYPPTIQPVMQRGIPLWIKNTFAPQDHGTLVEVAPPRTAAVVRGISSISSLALLSLEGSGMVGIPGFSRRLFAALARERINVILITQSSSEHSICVGVNEADAARSQDAVDEEFATEIAAGRIEPLRVETGLAIVALVGENMKSHPGISGKLFGALGHNGVNIRAIAQGSSEKNISTVIQAADVRKAINVVHEAFFEATYKQVNLFVLGAGNVGGKLLDLLARQQAYLLDKLRVQVRVVALASSRHCAVSDEGLDLGSWAAALDAAPPLGLDEFTQLIIDKNLRNSVLVDVTATPDTVRCYAPLLAKSVAVVACNKVAASSDYAFYAHLKSLAQEFNAPFLFETNVGAALPILNTLQDLVRTGDRVQRFEAVLSGTLNFVFNHYDGSQPFAEVVRQAQAAGVTEPDPRLDLSGTDVARKALILAREAGEVMEMSDIEIQGFLPASCFEGDVEAFYAQMLREEAHFRALYDQAAAQGKKLRFVAQYAEGRAKVGLQQLAPDHNLYDLRGKDNAIQFYTDCYVEQPLVIKGAGAGGEVTAAGVFADIMRAVL
ncbi:bifunctional aspartate kinase/homoserine dehydrogenase I [Hymenobacter saemangeumensis]|uniref:Bifunctional aspartate kinase/homoserine dehydrogenase I n=2 Tax=Hymenobacter saemangeumensis TaxID=1084522 RepID=A0ABP8I5J9_9BACT